MNYEDLPVAIFIKSYKDNSSTWEKEKLKQLQQYKATLQCLPFNIGESKIREITNIIQSQLSILELSKSSFQSTAKLYVYPYKIRVVFQIIL